MIPSSEIVAQRVLDPARLATLYETQLLDTPSEAAFDRFTSLACRILDAPTALVSLLDKDRQFFKSYVGLDEPWASRCQTPLSHSFCQYVVATTEPLVIEDARRHPLLCDSLAVRDLGVIAYAGIPLLTPQRQALGSFCVIDDRPRRWTEEEIAILQDLAAFVMTEIELRRASHELRENYEKLKAAEALRDSLTDMIVHDLRTPLTSTIMGLKMAPTLGPLNDSQEVCLSTALRGGETLLSLINDLLDISKMEAGAMPMQSTPLVASTLVQSALDQLMPLAQDKGLTLRLEIPPDLPVFEADEDKLRRTLVNLVGNAVKFTPRSGLITVTAQSQVFAPHGQTILFSVADTGEGIPAQDQQRIFEKFGQVETRDAGRHLSTGLGLTFCKLVIEAHQGRIWVESELQKGSTFFFYIPVETEAK